MGDTTACLMQEKEPIAIVGIGCRFPGGAHGTEAFWENLIAGVDAISEIPRDRWDIATYYDAEAKMPGLTNSRWGGLLGTMDQFDPAFFGISPREAALMDPQQRLLLETAWEAVEDAGSLFDSQAGSETGVFIGISTFDYAHIQTSPADKTACDAHSTTGSVLSIAANRISYALNFRGPSFVIDTACSSSLVAVHLACQSLRNGECRTALAGGVNAIVSPDTFIGFSQMSMLSPDGRCRAFDARGNGFVRGEGVGVIVLKPLSDAAADGDRIYAVIRGSAVNQDGRTSSLTIPSLAAQERLILAACADADVRPRDLEYIEAHGTGTAVGDPIETGAIGAVLSRDAERQPCVIGSVKTNIGHLEAASGIAGIIKTALVLYHGKIPPNLHFEQPNPDIAFEEWKIRVPVVVENLTRRDALAGINSFGFGGTNAHVIMQGSGTHVTVEEVSPTKAELFLLSARNATGLRDLVSTYSAWLATTPTRLGDICHTLATRRYHAAHRLAIAAATKAEVVEKLSAFLAGETRPGLSTGLAEPRTDVAFVFTGQGPQWWAMGRELLAHNAIFRERILECDRLFSEWGNWSLVEELSRDEATTRMEEPSIAQPAIFALQVALAAWWKAQGIAPRAVIGHSVGEAAAACISGALDFPSAARVIFERGRCMQMAPPTGKMLAVAAAHESAAAWLAGFERRVEVGAINAPRSIVFSGEAAALESVAQKLAAANIWHRFLRVNYAFHSKQMDPTKSALRKALSKITSHVPTIPMVSTVVGNVSPKQKYDADYWWQNVRQPVQFAAGIKVLVESGITTFLEIGPHPALSGSILECLKESGTRGFVGHSLRRGDPEEVSLLGSLGALHVQGIPIQWRGHGQVVNLPLYPWHHERFWHESPESQHHRLKAPDHPLLGRALHTAEPVWRQKILPELLPYLQDHLLSGRAVFPAAGYVEMALALARQTHGNVAIVLEDIEFQRALFLPDAETSLHSEARLEGGCFHIHAKMGSDSTWTSHVLGKIRILHPVPENKRESLEEIKARCTEQKSGADSYAEFHKSGFHFGPSFQGIMRTWRRDGEAMGEISAPSGLKLRGYHFHPAMLDSCFQVVLSSLTPDQVSRGLYLPVAIARMRCLSESYGALFSHVRLVEVNKKFLLADICLLDEEGRVLAQIEGFRCAAIEQGVASKLPFAEKFYEVDWKAADPRGEPTNEESLIVGAGGQALHNLELALDASPQIRHVIYVPASHAPPDAAAALLLCEELLGIARALIVRGLRLTIVTQNAQPVGANCVSPAHGALLGFIRVLINEHPSLGCRVVDVDALSNPCLSAETSVGGDEEVALRGTQRFVPRIARCSPKLRCLSGIENPYRLEIIRPGAFDQIAFVQHSRRMPLEDEVEVEVLAAGLNFRDVMKVLGIYPIETTTDHLIGDECAGRVVRVGSRVTHVTAGDEVIAMAPGCFAAFITIGSALVMRKPQALSYEEAATIPVTFLTAHYALHHLARIARGERVLIHAAAGGVGLAALQLALVAGCEVFATAGNDAKRDLVRSLGATRVMDSRSLDFADEILEATEGYGVDVVLNSLSGEAIPKSLSVLAPYGRFLEIGKRDIYQNSRLGLRPFRRNISFFAIDLGQISRDRPLLIAEMASGLVRQFEAGALKPLPRTIYPIAKASDAFREMAQGRHVGKIVFQFDAEKVRVEPQWDERLSLRADATYLITGGVRGFGLEIARWMIARGAKNLVLLGASQTSADRARAVFEQEVGVKVVTAAVDVSDAVALGAFLAMMAATHPPICGVVHAAMTMDDCLVQDLTPARLAHVMNPKGGGAWNLHLLTAPLTLDFFVMMSSLSSLVGNPGQANYAAANAFLDALAHHRRAAGLPALAIHWGQLGEVGYAARHAAVSSHLARYGVDAISKHDALAMLERLIRSENTQVAAMHVDWKRWAEANPRAQNSPRYEHVITSDDAAIQSNEISDALSKATGAERVRLLEEFICATAARVLGTKTSVIQLNKPLADYGLDSLMGIELVNRIEEGLKVRFPVEKLMGSPTVEKLAQALAKSQQ